MSGVAVLVTVDGQPRDPAAPLVYADDLAAVRGDGIFETLLVRDGRPCLLESHLQRLGDSARRLQLPPVDPAAWRRAASVAAAQWSGQRSDDGVLRLVYSRGRESGGPPTGYLTVGPVPGRVATVRRDGLAAITLDRGLASTAADAPWLLAGAKTLSYAVNMAALRYAADRGAGEVIFVSSDGWVLEGPRSTVVMARGEQLLTPAPTQPILHGTTQRALFAVAADKGYRCAYRQLRVSDLLDAEGLWLVSSVTLQARVHTLDGVALPPSSRATEFAGLVDAAVTGDAAT